MTNKTKQKNLIKNIEKKFDKLLQLKIDLTKPKQMLGASLIKRHLGTRAKKRDSFAYYLSTSNKGKTKLQHVSKNKVKITKEKVKAWKTYQQNVKEWKTVIKSIEQDFNSLGKIQNELEAK